jgi:hypothetical protein
MIKQGFRVPAFDRATARQARLKVKKDLNAQTPLLEMRGGVFDLTKAKNR